MSETKEDREERFWIEGNKAAYRALLSECLSELDESPLTQHASLVEQMSEIRSALRRLCDDIGADNTWPDDLHLVDVIDKYVGRRAIELAEAEEGEGG
jgi:replicative DNA helicase